MIKKNFASDNYAGVHEAILQSLYEANNDSAPAYGGDQHTAKAIEKFREYFGKDAQVFFVFNGTGANVTSLSALTHSYQAIICAASAHIQLDECGAPEKLTGSKLLLTQTEDGKLTPEHIAHHLQRVGDQHHVQPKVISISQSTEYGTLYQVEEIKALADFAHQHQLYLHMDGARISNAAASLQLNFTEFTKEAGIDVLSFGGTKNGMMMGEAVVFLNPSLANHYQYIRKQSMQLASKMRFIAAQFSALLTNDLWRHNAAHANAMATLLANSLKTIPGVTITKKVEANAIFAILPRHVIHALQQRFHFYVWNEIKNEVRLMTSFNTLEAEVEEFIVELKKLI